MNFSGLDSRCLRVLINKMGTMPAWESCYGHSVSAKQSARFFLDAQ